ncbi:hypothetical protein [uncultured Roseobacter sp.]|uniref:hypothetical protein n=1 Tax=uncultured Roseobacter sp. TaxID=114847 RepID=UPI00261CB3A6|nr:hypothetical protein [uncultured Roseobacter sp.]
MHPDIYKQYLNRDIRFPPDHQAELVDSMRHLSIPCRENILMLEKELRSNDPDTSERCGRLSGGCVVFAVVIPECKGHRLAVSLELAVSGPPPLMLHGVVAARNACDAARDLVVRHRNLVEKEWE